MRDEVQAPETTRAAEPASGVAPTSPDGRSGPSLAEPAALHPARGHSDSARGDARPWRTSGQESRRTRSYLAGWRGRPLPPDAAGDERAAAAWARGAARRAAAELAGVWHPGCPWADEATPAERREGRRTSLAVVRASRHRQMARPAARRAGAEP